ncbi:MAG: cupin domain-containing protein [Kofleriaceae bacterium]|nr:cupin domain-containing protein [Kofleriaceae bacterium]
MLASACGGTAKRNAAPSVPDKEVPTEDQLAAEKEAKQINAITSALNEFGPAVHTCWSRAAADDFRLEGAVTLGVTMLGQGRSDVVLLQDSAEDSVLSSCLLQLWREYQWADIFEPGDAVQLPPFEFVAPDTQFMVSQAHVPHMAFESGAIDAQVLLSKRNTGNDDAALAILRVSPGSTIPMRAHAHDEIFYVYAGAGSIDGRGGKREIAAGGAVYIPANTPHTIQQSGTEALQLVQFSVFPSGTGSGDASFLMASGDVHSGKVAKRGPASVVVPDKDAHVFPILSGKASVRVFFDANSPKGASAYLGVLRASPESIVPLHRHGQESEYLLILEGEAEMYVNGRTIIVRAGDGIQIPSGVEHGVKVLGTAQLKAVQFYTPPGPEARFKNGSK